MTIQTAVAIRPNHTADRFDGFAVRLVTSDEGKGEAAEVTLYYAEHRGRTAPTFASSDPRLLRLLALQILDAAEQIDGNGWR